MFLIVFGILLSYITKTYEKHLIEKNNTEVMNNYNAFKKIYPVLHKFKHENRDGKSNKLLHQQEVEEMKEIKNKQQQEQE